MALFDEEGAALYTQLGIKGTTVGGSPLWLDIEGLRGEPELGNEANLFSIPKFNSSSAGRGVGQAELPDFEFQINYSPGDVMHQVLPHLAHIVQTEGSSGDLATVTDTGSGTQSFSPGQIITCQLELKTASGSSSVAVFAFSARVGGFKFAPSTEDQTIATVVFALTGLPVGPDGTAIVFDTPASVAYS